MRRTTVRGEDMECNEVLDHAISIRCMSFRLVTIGSEELAFPLRLHCADAVDARGIALTNRFLYREELRLTKQMRTAGRYVIHLVILVLRYCDRLRNLARIGFARGPLRVMHRYYQPPG